VWTWICDRPSILPLAYCADTDVKLIKKMRRPTCCIWALRVASNNNTNWAVELSSIVHRDDLGQRCLVERVPLSIGSYYWRTDLNLSGRLIRRRCLADLTAAKYTPPQINKIVLYCIHKSTRWYHASKMQNTHKRTHTHARTHTYYTLSILISLFASNPSGRIKPRTRYEERYENARALFF